MAVVALLGALVARHGDLLRIDHDDEVARVDVGRVGRLALPAQRVGDLGGEPAEGLALGVDEQPVALAVKWCGDVGLHGGAGHADATRDRAAAVDDSGESEAVHGPLASPKPWLYCRAS